MKKFLLIAACMAMIAPAVDAQIAGPRQLINAAGTTLTHPDTFSGAASFYLYTPVMSGGSKLTIQVNSKKVTGTVLFNTFLEVSGDGDASHTWNVVPPDVADTLNGGNGDNTKIWTVDKQAKVYRIRHDNATGTSAVKAWFTYW